MSDNDSTKTAVIEPDVHAAVKVLSALYDKPIQEIVNEAIRAQYDVETLANIDEAVLSDGAEGELLGNVVSEDSEIAQE